MATAIFSAIAALPKLMGYLETFVSWINNQIQIAKNQKLTDDLAKSAQLAKETKDTSGLDNIFDPNKKK